MRVPAFQFYPSDWLASQRVAMMSLEEEGTYIRLLSYCWLHGSIPADPAKCCRLVGKGGSTTVVTVVQAMFAPHPDDADKLVHDRLEAERIKQEIWRKKSSDGGKRSAEGRKRPTVVQPPLQGWLPNGGNQKATLQSSSSSSSSSSTATSDPDPDSLPLPPPDAPPSAGREGKTRKVADALPTTPEAIAIANLFRRSFSTAWSAKEIKAFKDGTKRGVITMQAIKQIERYYAEERTKEAAGRHRRDLATFLNNFDGELDRANAFAAPVKRDIIGKEGF